MRYYKSKSGFLIPFGTASKQGWGETAGDTQRKETRNFNPVSGSPTGDLDRYNPRIRSRARALYISGSLGTALVNTKTLNVVGTGLELNSRIDYEFLGMTRKEASQWQKKTEFEWSLWAKDARNFDAAGIDDFDTATIKAFKNACISGDIFAARQWAKSTRMQPYATRIRLIEADRCSTPDTDGLTRGTAQGVCKATGNKIFDGVEVDKNRRVTAFHFRSNYPNERGVETPETKWTRVAAEDKAGLRNVLHIVMADRPEQYRGVSAIAPIMTQILQLRRYTDAELMAAIVQSYIAIVYKQTSQDGISGVFGDGDMEAGLNLNELGGSMGEAIVAPYGLEATAFQPTHPATKYPEFYRTRAVEAGAAGGVSGGSILREFTNSYSASRAAMLADWKDFKVQRKWLSKCWCNPMYEFWLSEAVARGRIQARGFFDDPARRRAFLGSEWIGAPAGQIDPVKEVNAQILACQNGLNTWENATMELGNGYFGDNIAKLHDEIQRLREAGIQIGSFEIEETGGDDDGK
ncbi:MAG: phage portal protein [Oscillospiraceae bacterium]|nr:phage portal protein [Oscillospiraceae bacterium]